MDDAKDMNAILDLLISENPRFVGRKRVLDAANGVNAVLHEIGATELGTQLMFSSRNCSLHLNVANCNVISIALSDPSQFAEYMSVSLMPDEEDHVRVLAKSIQSLADDARATKILFLEMSDLPAKIAEEPGRVYPSIIGKHIEGAIQEDA